MTELAKLQVEHRQGVLVAHVAGEIDGSNAADVGERLLGELSNQARGMVLDLSETEYFDSSGVHLLFDMARRLKLRQQELRVVAGQESFAADLLELTGFAGAAPVDDSVSSAVGALSERS